MRRPRQVDAAVEGHYYRKQLGCRSGIIAWSHRARFRLGLRLLGPTPGTVLDYGCGDGTFLAMAADRVRHGCGADIASDQVEDCTKRLGSHGNLSFCTVRDLSAASHDGSYDVVTCMETLEHCPPAAAEAVLRDLARLVAPRGRVVISVPIETGPAFLLKGALRRVAAWRGLSDYRHYERYAPRQALQMLFAGRNSTIERPVYGPPETPYHSHYGFNWRAMRERVRAHLSVERTVFSPVGFLGGLASSQAWFLCRPSPDSGTRGA